MSIMYAYRNIKDAICEVARTSRINMVHASDTPASHKAYCRHLCST